MTQNFRVPDVVCAENIVLNYLLHEIPKPPQQKRRSLNSSNKTYTLPFSKERDLVEVLSFLSKTRDGSDYIPAVCVEEDPTGKILKVLLAVNKSTWSDGDDILRALKEGFGNIFSVLHESQYENGSSSEVKKEILDSILAMCSSRILCRLRLIPSKRKGNRATIKDILQKAIEGIRCINLSKIYKANLMNTLSSFTTESKKVIQLVNNWSTYQAQPRLRELVEGIYRLNKVQNVSGLLHLIPSGASGVVQDSNFASSLLNIISKVSRYHESARVLHRIAKRFPLVRNMEPQLATIPREAYDRLYNSEYSPSLHTVQSLLGLINGKRYELSQIYRFMRSAKNKSPSEQFSNQVKKTLKEAKVHSEIQLIAYCEIQSPELFPRVIASSKDACFLCNTFIEKHGKMHTSRTHGRLYPGWRLPTILHFKTLQQEFNQVLLNQARQSIGARATGRAPIYPQPLYESTLLPLSVSVTTMSTLHHEVLSPTPEKPMLVDLTSPRLESVAAKDQVAGSTPSSGDSLATSYKLAPGEKISCYLGPKGTSFFVAGPLEVQIEMEPVSASEPTATSLAYSIERIESSGAGKMLDECFVINLSELEEETLYELPADNTFCLAAQNVALRIISYPSVVD